MNSPKISAERKKELLANCSHRANPLIVNTLQVLIDRKRINEVVHVVDEFDTLANEAQGIAEAKVYSTRALYR